MSGSAHLARRGLHSHPATPCAAVHAIEVALGVDGDAIVARFGIRGDPSALRIPDPAAPLDPQRLWATTCVELFVAPAAGLGYVEWNFSPTGQTACFRFSEYRQRIAAPASEPAPQSRATIAADGLWVSARAHLPGDVGEDLRLSATAVIETAGGELSYWALRHPGPRPDFHHRDGFALSLTLGAVPAIVGP